MIIVLFVLSLFGVAISFLLPGYTDLLLLAGPCALASFWIHLREARRSGLVGLQRFERFRTVEPGSAAPSERPDYVIIDGSNVMHWGEAGANLGHVSEVLRLSTERGLLPGVVFDANVGYKISDRYLGNHVMSHMLGLPVERVHVVDKGVIADSFILMVARSLNAPIITADRYRDHVEEYPEVLEPGHLIRGGVRDGKVWVEW